MANGNCLINRAGTKDYILKVNERVRPGWKFERVSRSALDKLEAKLKNIIIESLKKHPSVGVTFKEVLL